VIEITPNFAPAWFNKGNALAKLGKFDVACINKGTAFDKLGKHEDAIKYYDKANKIHQEFS